MRTVAALLLLLAQSTTALAPAFEPHGTWVATKTVAKAQLTNVENELIGQRLGHRQRRGQSLGVNGVRTKITPGFDQLPTIRGVISAKVIAGLTEGVGVHENGGQWVVGQVEYRNISIKRP